MDLKNYKVGGVSGFNYSFYKDQFKIDIGAKDRIALFKKLHKGRIQLAIAQKEVVFSMNKQKLISLNGIASVPDPVKPTKTYYILIGKKHPQSKKLQKIVDEEIVQLRKNGQYEKIFENYLGRTEL